MSLRLRLTLLYTTILVLALVGFSAALYFTQSRVTLDVVRQTLTRTAQRADELYTPADPLAVPEALAQGDTFVQTRRPDGSVVAGSTTLAGRELPLSPEALRAALGGASGFETSDMAGESMLIYYQPIAPAGESQPLGVRQVAHSLADRERSLGSLGRTLLLGSLGAMLLALWAGWWAADLALLPVNRLTSIARDIGDQRDFDRRVEYTGPDDEIGRLAATFNGMLAELQAAQLDTEQALQAQRRFVADASHELRTPLTSLRGNLDLLRREPPIREEDRRAVVADMADEIERLIRLVSDLLTLARSDAGRPLRHDPVRIQPLIEDVCRQGKLLAPARSISAAGAGRAAGGELAALGDQDAIKQVVLILLDNALKHTPPEARVSMTAKALDGYVAIHVHDTGPGIDPDVLPGLFNRFSRGDNSRAGPGTGLGLAIAKRLVEAQNGTITVSSAPGQGTTFTVTLPRAAQ